MEEVDLKNVEDVYYHPKPLGNAGELKLQLKGGKQVILTSVSIGQSQGDEAIKTIREAIKKNH